MIEKTASSNMQTQQSTSHHHHHQTPGYPATNSSSPHKSRSIRILPRRPDPSRLQQENYEAFVNSRDDMMYQRIATSRNNVHALPLSAVVDNSLPVRPQKSTLCKPTSVADAPVDKGSDNHFKDVAYDGEEGIFELDL